MTPVEQLLQTARAEIGYIEKETNSQLDNPTANPGDGNWNKYARDLDALGIVYNGRKNGYAWCDCFVDWCFIHTFGLEVGMDLLCQAEKGLGAGAPIPPATTRKRASSTPTTRSPEIRFSLLAMAALPCTTPASWKKSPGAGSTPSRGTRALCPAWWRTAAASGTRATPWGASYIGGYGRPNFSIVPEEDDEMLTYEQWKEYMTKYRQELQDNDCGDWPKEAREWAIRVGLFAGNGTTVDGQPNMMWQDQLSREQAAQLFYRFAKNAGLA